MNRPPTTESGKRFDPRTISRPDPLLLRHYTILSMFAGPFFPFVWLPCYFKYRTLQYRFDEDGVWMAWGLLFKRETNLAYRRIQDINVTRGIIQRWLGLASVSVQTASGSSTAEMTIEGILQADELRDFLYARTRGARQEDDQPETAEDDLTGLLTQIRDNARDLAARVAALEERSTENAP